MRVRVANIDRDVVVRVADRKEAAGCLPEYLIVVGNCFN